MYNHLAQALRETLFRLWSRHEREVVEEGRRLAYENTITERAYAAGFRDGYFAAVADLIREGMVDGSTAHQVPVGLGPANHDTIH